MSKLLKERWNRLAFGKGNQSLNESDRFHGVLPQELWEISDYEDYRDSGIDLRGYSDEELQMKIEQLLEEIEEEKQYMDDPQNQYDSAIAPKESLISVIQDIIGQVHLSEHVYKDEMGNRDEGSFEDIVQVCVRELNRDTEKSIEQVVENWASMYGIPYDQIQAIKDEVYRRL